MSSLERASSSSFSISPLRPSRSVFLARAACRPTNRLPFPLRNAHACSSSEQSEQNSRAFPSRGYVCTFQRRFLSFVPWRSLYSLPSPTARPSSYLQCFRTLKSSHTVVLSFSIQRCDCKNCRDDRLQISCSDSVDFHRRDFQPSKFSFLFISSIPNYSSFKYAARNTFPLFLRRILANKHTLATDDR